MDTIWIKFLRENVHTRESFFKFMAELKVKTMDDFANLDSVEKVWRMQGGVRALDFITVFVTKELEQAEQNNAGRTNGQAQRA